MFKPYCDICKCYFCGKNFECTNGFKFCKERCKSMVNASTNGCDFFIKSWIDEITGRNNCV